MKNLKFKFLILPLLTISLIFSLSLVFLIPKIAQIGILRNNISTGKKILKDLTFKASLLSGMDKEDVFSKVEKTLRILPLEKDIPQTLISLKAIANQTGITLKRMEIDPGSSATTSGLPTNKGELKISSFDVNLIALGTSDKINPFLEMMESTYPLMKIGKITFIKKEADYEINLKVSSYFLAKPSQIGALETPLPQLESAEENTYELISAKFSSPVGLEGGAALVSPSIPGTRDNPFTPPL